MRANDDPFELNPEWKEWVLTLITIEDIIEMPHGSAVGRMALMKAEVLDSQSEHVNVGDIVSDNIPLGQNTAMWHNSDKYRKYACFDTTAEAEIGSSFLVATYFQDSPDGRSRASVTKQWAA